MDNRRSPSPSPQPSSSSSQSRRQRSRSRSRSRSPSNRTTMSHQTCVSKKSDSSSKSGDGQATTTTVESSLQASASSIPVFSDATAANPLFPGGMATMPMTAFGGQMMQMQMPQGVMAQGMPQGVMPVPVMMVPSSMFAPSNMFTPFAAQTTPLTVTPNLMNAANKVNRELFVGNTPPGISEQLLIQFMNGAMQRTKLCPADRRAIISCRLNAKFAFIECATPDDADKALNLNGIPFMGMNLRVSRPSKYAGPHVPSKTWQELTGLPVATTTMMTGASPSTTGAGGAAAPSPADDKINRELYIGNTTPEMTESSLTDFLGKALEHVGLTKKPGNPITACQISGKYAFAEFRSVEETSNALNLNNIPFMGAQLRVSRPSKYPGPDTPHLNWEDILSKCMSGELKLQDEVQSLRPKPTRVVQLKNMLTADDLESDEDYNEVLEETKEECAEFGNLKNIIIPRTGVGSTKIFLEYETMDDAARAIQALAGRTFDGRTIDAGYMDETKYQSQDYSD